MRGHGFGTWIVTWACSRLRCAATDRYMAATPHSAPPTSVNDPRPSQLDLQRPVEAVDSLNEILNRTTARRVRLAYGCASLALASCDDTTRIRNRRRRKTPNRRERAAVATHDGSDAAAPIDTWNRDRTTERPPRSHTKRWQYLAAGLQQSVEHRRRVQRDAQPHARRATHSPSDNVDDRDARPPAPPTRQTRELAPTASVGTWIGTSTPQDGGRSVHGP